MSPSIANFLPFDLTPEIYWTIIASFFAAVWAVISSIRARNLKAIEYSRMVVGRLLEADKMVLENPDVQQYLSKASACEEAWFRSDEVLTDPMFFKAKSLVYSQLNFFDEILAVTHETARGFHLFRPPAILENEKSAHGTILPSFPVRAMNE